MTDERHPFERILESLADLGIFGDMLAAAFVSGLGYLLWLGWRKAPPVAILGVATAVALMVFSFYRYWRSRLERPRSEVLFVAVLSTAFWVGLAVVTYLVYNAPL